MHVTTCNIWIILSGSYCERHIEQDAVSIHDIIFFLYFS